MAEPVRARDLMRTAFRTVRATQTLGEAMRVLREVQGVEELPNAVMVVDDDGRFAGMLTAKLLIRMLVGPAQDAAHDGEELLLQARERLVMSCGEALVLDVPVVAPQDRLLTIVRRGLPTRLDFVPVVDEGRPVGLVPVTAIFQAAAALALTPEHEGIRFDR
ncbi:MAG: CBS domain-containing protein [Planctomycetes bacterium]|nr:CBS domain-containing protein [Planctomycetota bacterium]